MEDREGSKPVSFWQQVRALFLKDVAVQRRSVATNICQILVPIIFISIVGGTQILITSVLSDNNIQLPGSELLSFPKSLNYPAPCNYTIPYKHPDYCSPFYPPIPRILAEQIPSVAKRLDFRIQAQFVLFNLPQFYFIRPTHLEDAVGELDWNGTASGFLGLLSSKQLNFTLDFRITYGWLCDNFNCDKDYMRTIQAPFFTPINSEDALNDLLVSIGKEYLALADTAMSIKEIYNRTYSTNSQSYTQYTTILKNVQNYQFSKVKPHGGISFHKLTSDELDFTVIAPKFQFDLTIYETQRRGHIINMMSNAFFRHLTGNRSSVNAINAAMATMPVPSTPVIIDVSSLVGNLLMPFATSFLMPVFMWHLVKDKHEKHLIMMQQSGLNRWAYWFSIYCFNFALYIAVSLVIVFTGLSFQLRVFTQTSTTVLVVVFFTWGHSLVILGFFFSHFFSRPRLSSVVGYVVVILGVLIADLLSATNVFPNDQNPNFVYMLYPPFSFYRALFYLNFACGQYDCYTWQRLTTSGDLLVNCLYYLLGSTICLAVFSVYLAMVLPGEFGINRSPLFIFKEPYYWFLRKRRRHPHGLSISAEDSSLSLVESMNGRVIPPSCDFTMASEEVVMPSPSCCSCIGLTPLPTPPVDTTFLDEEVIAEDQRIAGGLVDCPVVMYRLRKTYPSRANQPAKHAVRGVSLSVARNECFGLLGANGAGKTSLISILTGVFPPSGGVGRIAGYDLATQMSVIYRHIGVCPQFDIQYPELTVRQHLLFYARLKGVPRRKERKQVDEAISKVSLTFAADRQSKDLSGGMRRRLSVAMAFIGKPSILILDEPTTGLDPLSRREVWQIIKEICCDCSLILTTHDMDEADHLCRRIGIMNQGRLLCLGSPTHLKNRFGSGYHLQIYFEKHTQSIVRNFVVDKFSSAVLLEEYPGMCAFRLDKDIDISRLFELLGTNTHQLGILDWGIKRTSLEDVFLRLVRTDEERSQQLQGRMACTESSIL